MRTNWLGVYDVIYCAGPMFFWVGSLSRRGVSIQTESDIIHPTPREQNDWHTLAFGNERIKGDMGWMA